jgi:DMSO/TMAO reductase YedYZ molybdopterin-dependent catalytic subunit
MGRRTNLALLAALAAAFVTGWLAFGLGTAAVRLPVLLHAIAGFAILALLPWKSVVVRRGLRRRRAGRWASAALGILVLASIAGGILHSTGLLRWWGTYTAMELHVGAALLALPLAIWHVLARPVRPARVDLRRRALLKQGAVLGLAAAAYSASEAAVRLSRLPGAGRRFTGSYEIGSLQPDLMPVSSWMFDSVPVLEADPWRLRVSGPSGAREWTYAELAEFDDSLRAVLDCTGGFWSEQDWSGVLLHRLLPELGQALSVRVVSHTGYERRFASGRLSSLLLATRLGGQPLSPDHGHPARLVVPDQRGFWWVKWVAAVELDPLPDWWQPPFPLR